MIPPESIHVLDSHGGFTALTTHKKEVLGRGNTLWRPCHVLSSFIGTLVDYREDSFYQLNEDVTIARYKVPGYCCPVILWFDNKSGARIA